MNRTTVIAGNWKMHKTVEESRALVRELLDASSISRDGVVVAIAPPFTALAAVAHQLRGGEAIALCGQTMHWSDAGAFTGEISPTMLLDVGCTHVLLGHSERRAHCAETDASVNAKVHAALAHGMTPIVAVGETLVERDRGETTTRIVAQTAAAFADVEPTLIARCIVAYEPIWAIGTGLVEDAANANEAMGAIRACLRALAEVTILYGGSVKPANAGAMLAQPHIDGALVGGASLVAASFNEIVQSAHRARIAR